MNPINDGLPKGFVVKSLLGKLTIDSDGSAISSVRLDPVKAYSEIPYLLKKYIEENDNSSWEVLCNKIDYLYNNLDYALAILDRETSFHEKIISDIAFGKKLFLIPNLNTPCVIDSIYHNEGFGESVCTEWLFIAAIMRWFHDRLDISYYQMAFGVSKTSTLINSEIYSRSAKNSITAEAIIEGRSGDFYGGWGFYFIRKYLKSHHPASHIDNPMKGYEDSVIGKYISPGKACDRLMVYDLSSIQDDVTRYRTITIEDDNNMKEITIHKIIIGGDPNDEKDMEDYPGCVLINVPKLMMHTQDIISNALNNLDMSYPKNQSSIYFDHKTIGLTYTKWDVIRAIQSQNVFMLHITDAIHIINFSSELYGSIVKVPEGFIWSSLDPVALDYFCARYCFKTVSMVKGLKLRKDNNWNTEFVQHVPIPQVSGTNIITIEGFDSPLLRYKCYQYAEELGIGQQNYYITGYDSLTRTPMASLGGHLGRIESRTFVELFTTTIYYNQTSILHHFQKTILGYLKSYDILTGSSLYKDFLELFDENNDETIGYDEKGLRNELAFNNYMTYTLDIQLNTLYGSHKRNFMILSYIIKNSMKEWNPQGNDFMKEWFMVRIANMAYQLSMSKGIHDDLYIQEMHYGRGMWPSWQTAVYCLVTSVLYGSREYSNIILNSLYGTAFQYADKVLNSGQFTGSIDANSAKLDSIRNYFDALSKGSPSLHFTLYVPKDYGYLGGDNIPNVVETDDPGMMFTVHFTDIW